MGYYAEIYIYRGVGGGGGDLGDTPLNNTPSPRQKKLIINICQCITTKKERKKKTSKP